jgi:ketosteroid isomerase-like protein
VNDAEVIAELRAHIDTLESQIAIRAVMSGYMRLCEHLGPETQLQELAELFTPEAQWLGIGQRYGATYGSHSGRAAILAMLGAYCNPPHFAFNAHFLTSETITVSGNCGQGRWMMLQTATYAGGSSDLRSARLNVAFARTQGRWQISRFETENMFSRKIDHWDDASTAPLPSKQHREG